MLKVQCPSMPRKLHAAASLSSPELQRYQYPSPQPHFNPHFVITFLFPSIQPPKRPHELEPQPRHSCSQLLTTSPHIVNLNYNVTPSPRIPLNLIPSLPLSTSTQRFFTQTSLNTNPRLNIHPHSHSLNLSLYRYRYLTPATQSSHQPPLSQSTPKYASQAFVKHLLTYSKLPILIL